LPLFLSENCYHVDPGTKRSDPDLEIRRGRRRRRRRGAGAEIESAAAPETGQPHI
jgi:hypothetical protein